jgi:hypothetical protein
MQKIQGAAEDVLVCVKDLADKYADMAVWMNAIVDVHIVVIILVMGAVHQVVIFW